MEKINETKSWFFEKINRIDKLLARLIKKKRESPNQQNQKWKRSYNQYYRNTKDQRDYYEQLFANKMDNLDEMEKFLEMYNLPRLNKEEIKNMNRPITSNEIESVI